MVDALGWRRVLAGLAPGEDGPELAPAGVAEVEGRPDALARERDAVPGRVADEEHAVLGRAAQPVREPVALVAHGRAVEAPGQVDGRLADVVARLVRAHADALLAAGRDAPAVAVADQRALDPDVQVDSAALGVHLEPARERGVGRLVGPGREHAAPPERVDHQRRAQLAAVGHDQLAATSGHLRDLEAGVALIEQQPAQLGVVEGRPAPGQAVADRAVRRVEAHAGQLLPDRAGQPERLEPRQRRRARRRGALADLVAVDQQDVGAAAGELARDGQPGEARAAHEHVG